MNHIPKIVTKAICVIKKGDKFLFSIDYDSQKRSHYARPLGGHVEFQEFSKDTVIREFKEETGFEITTPTLLTVLENIFELEGMPYHEIVFLYRAEFKDQSVYQLSELKCIESGIPDFKAYWLSLKELQARAIRLVPEGIEKWIGFACGKPSAAEG